MSPAALTTLNAQPENTSSAVAKPISVASTEILNTQQQTTEVNNGIENTMSIDFQAPSLNHLQHSEPSSSTEDQLPKLITGPDDNIRQSKLNQDPKREVVKHTLLQEELAQLREENLNLRVDLQLAREKHKLLESEHGKCKKREKKMGKAMKKAIKNLSMDLDLPEGSSADPKLATGDVVAAVSLPPQQLADNPTIERPSSSLSVGGTVGGTRVQTKIFGQNLITNTSLGFLGSPGVNRPLPSVTGDPVRMIQPLDNNSLIILSTPGFYNGQEQSFEEARLRRYEMSKMKAVASQIPKGLELFGSFKIPAPHNSFNSLSSSTSIDQQSKKRKIGNDAEDREGQILGSMDVAGPNERGSSQPAGPEGAGTANGRPAISDTGKMATASPFQKAIIATMTPASSDTGSGATASLSQRSDRR